MELKNDFRVSVPVERAWSILTDVERIAPCMPGADLEEIEGDEYRGVVKVKVGPITAQYRGKATWVERDDAGHRAVLKAEGRDTRGQGNASATITASLTADGDGTAVTVVTDLTVTGRVAQFGRGVLADVSAKLVNQFLDCLETDVLRNESPPPAGGRAGAETTGVEAPNDGATRDAASGDGKGRPNPVTAPVVTAPPEDGGGSETPRVRRVESRPSEPVDLLGTAGMPVAKRAAPFVAALFVVAWLIRHRRHRRRR
jgi:carbon monoxide dehydrogenase subunit G